MVNFGDREICQNKKTIVTTFIISAYFFMTYTTIQIDLFEKKHQF